MIKNKQDALEMIRKNKEFNLPSWDFSFPSIWFRDNENGTYTIDHEIQGIIGATQEEVASYIYRNRKFINKSLKV